ncbi:lipase [Hortaea werneckii]|nr:lipase [Hortaea werneckii]
MIDHVLGRPSTRFRKYQVFTVVLLWSLYLYRGDRHGPKPLRGLSKYLSKHLTTWRSIVVFCLTWYVSRNFARVVGLESPEPLANLYTRSYFRATWVTTALDAGFWTAMHLRPKWLKDLASVVFTMYYLVCAEQADEMVRKVRGGLTLQHLRVSWDKPNTPYIAAVTKLLRPKKCKLRSEPVKLRIHRPKECSYQDPIHAWLYYDGPISDLKHHDKVVLDIPGGGFVAMDPRCHDDKLLTWAARTGLPVLALDYRKAPEYPYPYALNECYDAYHTLITSRGRCIGMSGAAEPKIVVSGDSAGGNLAVGLILMLLQNSPHASYVPGVKGRSLPLPEALVCIYPALDMNISNWMTDEQMALIKAPERRGTNQAVLRHKSDDYKRLTPDTPHGSDEFLNGQPASSAALRRTVSRSAKLLETEPTTTSPISTTDADTPHTSAAHTVDTTATATKSPHSLPTRPQPLRTRLAMSSMISYFNDRILSPEMLRAMIILYIGPYNRPDFATDFLLSPLLAPENLLAHFPKLYLLTGERDPLVDDTVIFAGRLRQAKLQRFQERQELGLLPASARFDERQHVEVMLIPGISHGFLQFVSVFPDGWKHIAQCSRWMKRAFQEAEGRERDSPIGNFSAGDSASAAVSVTATPMEEEEERRTGNDYFDWVQGARRTQHHRSRAGSSDLEDRPLEMGLLSMTAARNGRHGSGNDSGSNTSTRRSKEARHAASGRGQVQKPSTGAMNGGGFSSGRRSPITTRKSLVRLASTEDLMSRRMHGLTNGMMGDGLPPKTP